MASSSKLSNLQKLLFDHKQTFFNLDDFLDFASDFLEFLSDNKQAVIVSQIIIISFNLTNQQILL